MLNELQTFETISKTRSKEGEVNVAQRKPSSLAGRTKRKKKPTGGSGARPNKAKKAPSSSGKCWAWCPKKQVLYYFLEINNKDIFAMIECFILVWYNLINIRKSHVHLCNYSLSV